VILSWAFLYFPRYGFIAGFPYITENPFQPASVSAPPIRAVLPGPGTALQYLYYLPADSSLFLYNPRYSHHGPGGPSHNAFLLRMFRIKSCKYYAYDTILLIVALEKDLFNGLMKN
jgi:hypothetical protein